MKTNSVSNVMLFTLFEVEEMHKKNASELSHARKISSSYLDQIIILEAELEEMRQECEHYKAILQDF